MTLLIRKYFWSFNLLTIALCALMAAMAVGHCVEANLPRVKARRAAGLAPGMGSSQSSQNRDITQILARNIFCSGCDPVIETPIERPGADENGEPNSDAPVKTQLEIKLIATLISDEDRAWSYAAIGNKSDQKTHLLAIGSEVPGGAVITDILNRRVLLLNNNRNEYLDLDTGETASTAIASTPRVAFRTPKPLAGMAAIGKGIRKVGEGKYEIARRALNKVLANTTLLARSARIVPSVRNGKPNGFKLYAIRPGSLYSLLGMFNGDTINAVNGHSINTPDKALEIYTKLRSASHVTIAFTRRGKPLNHEYTIR